MTRAAIIGIVLAGFAAACSAPTSGPAPRSANQVPADTVAAAPFGPEFRDARALGIDPRGRLYVSDAGADVVHRLLPDGQPLPSLGGPGSGDYAFLSPAGLDPTNGLSLYVADRDNGRIQRFSHEDRLLETILVPADPIPHLGRRTDDADRGRPTAVSAAPTGEVFVVEENREVVLMWDNRRNLARVVGDQQDGRGALSEPVGLAIAPDGRLFVADAGHGAVLVFDPYGEFLRRMADGIASDVRAVAVDHDRVAVFLRDRILLYEMEGMLDRVVIVGLPSAIVGGGLSDGQPILLTASSLWRIEAGG